MYSILSAAGGYITFLGIFIIVRYTERMSELVVINVNEAHRMGINAGPCAVERMDTTVTAQSPVMPSTLQYSFLCYMYIYKKLCEFGYVPNSCVVIYNKKLSYNWLILHK